MSFTTAAVAPMAVDRMRPGYHQRSRMSLSASAWSLRVSTPRFWASVTSLAISTSTRRAVMRSMGGMVARHNA